MATEDTIVVTGASGFISRILCELLLEQNYKVIAVDRVVRYPDWKHPNLSFYHSDLMGASFLDHVDKSFRNGSLRAVVHLAADSLLGPSVKSPIEYYLNNVGTSTQFLNYLIKKMIYVPFVFASSAAVYGDIAHPVTESEARLPINPYGRTKYQFEQLLQDVNTAYAHTSVSFRFFNVVGGLQSLDGKDAWLGQPIDQPHILTSIFRAATSGSPFVLNGTAYGTDDGTPVRDYIHVHDVCDTIIEYIERPIWNKATAFNLGSGIPVSNQQIVNAFINMFGQKYPSFEVVNGPARPGDPEVLVADTNNFVAEFGDMRASVLDLPKCIETAHNAFLYNSEQTQYNVPLPARITYA